MQTEIRWQAGLTFQASVRGHDLTMDAAPPLGADKGMTPKELVLLGLCGCTAMDVVAYLRKFKQVATSLVVSVDANKSSGKAPQVFTAANLKFVATGPVDPEILLKAVTLSQTQYCGVSAMLAKAFPITFEVWLDETRVGGGQAAFASA